MTTRARSLVVATLAAAACMAAMTVPARAAAGIAMDTFVHTVGARLSDPGFEGRGAGTAGLDSAAAFLGSVMADIGLLPGGDGGTYFQFFEITTGVRVEAPSSVRVGDAAFEPGPDVQPIGFSTNGTLTAPVVFAGYGITAPGFEYDDYANIDATGAFVLVLSREPAEMDSSSRFNGDINTAHAELRSKAINAREHGALGMLVVDGPLHHAGAPLPEPRTGSTGYMTSGLLAARVSQSVAERLLEGSGFTLDALQRAIDAHERPHSTALPGSATVTVSLRRTRAEIRNVVGWLRGRDTTRTLVMGAHYDHLGYGGDGSLDPDARVPHVGADDNASGTVATLRAAAHFAQRAALGRPPAHNMVFCAFTGEESGLLGSAHFVDSPTVPLETVEAMLNMDMVGRLRNNTLIVMGAGTAAEFKPVLQNVNAASKFELKTTDDGFGPSDHSSFYKRKVPVLSLFTGVHTDYHKPSDTWDKVNVEGLERVARFAAAVFETLDARPAVTYTVADAAPMGRIRGGGGYGAYLGTIPDYVQTEGGVLLSGVRDGGPAHAAGLRGGDTVVRFDGVPIDNIYDYTYALRSRKPGQQVRVTVRRDGTELDMTVTLGRRGEQSRRPQDSTHGGHP